MPDHLALTLWGMTADDRTDPDEPALDVWGEGLYAIDVEVDGLRTATLQLGSGDIEFAALPTGDGAITGDPSGLPVLSIELSQSAAPSPGSQRTLLRDDFGAARVRAVIEGAVFVDDTPTVDVALDLATGATEVTAAGVLRRVGGADADERIYAIEGQGITPVDCTYRALGDDTGKSWRPPTGHPDVCRALVETAAELPTSSRTPALPWNPDPPEFETVCGL